jgi:hypothetical protein
MRLALIAATIMGVGLGGYVLSASAATTGSTQGAASARAQARETLPARSRPRIVITPRRVNGSLYPSPYPYAWPGPGAVRDCVAWLEPEARPSGTVIVPRERCAWVRR